MPWTAIPFMAPLVTWSKAIRSTLRDAWVNKGRESTYSKGRDSLRRRIRYGKLARRLRWFENHIPFSLLLRN